MPKLIDIEGLGEVEFPDEATPEDVLSFARKHANVGPKVTLPPSPQDFGPSPSQVKADALRAELAASRSVNPLVEYFSTGLDVTPSPRLGAALASPIGAPIQPFRPAPGTVSEVIHEAGRSAAEPLAQTFQPELLPLTPLLAIPGPLGQLTRRAAAIYFGGQMTGAGAGELSAGLGSGEPKQIGHGLGQVLAGGPILGHGLNRVLESPMQERARMVAEMIQGFNPEAPFTVRQQETAPQSRLGIFAANPNALAEPGIRTLVNEILEERRPEKSIQIPGRERALDVLTGLVRPGEPLVYEGGPPTAEAQRLGGGPARFGKLSYGAEAPTLLRNVPEAGIVQPQELPQEQPGIVTGPSGPYRPPRPAPTPEEALRRQLRENVEKGLTEPMPPMEPVEPTVGQYPLEGGPKGTLSNLQRSRILAQQRKQQGGPNAPRVRGDQGPVREEGLPTEGGEEARGKNLQREQTGQAQPGASGVQGQGLGVAAAQRKAAQQRGQAGAIRPRGSEKRTDDLVKELLKTIKGPSEEGLIGLPSVVAPLDPERMTTIPEHLKPPPAPANEPIAVRYLTNDQLMNVAGNLEVKAVDTARLNDPDMPKYEDLLRRVTDELTKRGLPAPSSPRPITMTAREQGKDVGPSEEEQAPGTLEDQLKASIELEREKRGMKLPQEEGWVSAFDKKKRGQAGSFILPGPELMRTVSGFKKTATVAGQQLLNRMRNILHPDEMRAYEKEGIGTFLSRPRTPEETAKWMEENGPKIETKLFGGKGPGTSISRQHAMAQHELETLGYSIEVDPRSFDFFVEKDGKRVILPEQESSYEPGSYILEKDLPAKEQELIREWNRTMAASETTGSLDPDDFRPVSPKDEPQKMVVVRQPIDRTKYHPERATETPKEKAARQVLHEGSHLGSEDVNVLGWARGHDEVIGGKKVWNVDEVQDDLIDKDINGKYYFTGNIPELKGKKFDTFNEANAALAKAWPVTKDRQRTVLKSLITQAIREGKDAVTLPDFETVSMSEGHDQSTIPTVGRYEIPGLKDAIVNPTSYSPEVAYLTGKVYVVDSIGDARYVLETTDGRKIPLSSFWSDSQNKVRPQLQENIPQTTRQEAGMRQNYDPSYRILDRKGEPLAKETFPDAESAHAFAQNRTAGLGLKEGSYEVSRGVLHDIMEELTGVKGQPVDIGPHQNAFEPYTAPAETEFGSRERSKARVPREGLIYRNPDGTPRTEAKGLLYDLSKVKERKEPFSLFGSEKLPGIKIPTPGTKGREAGAFVLPPILKKIVDKLTPEPGKPLTDVEVEYGTKGPVIMFRTPEVEKKIATSPQGIGKIPGLGQLFDPRASAKDPVMRAILTGQSMMFKAKQISTLFLEATKVNPRAFLEDDSGMATLASGAKLPTSTIIRREIASPGSQPLTAEQREFVNMWRVLRKGLVDYARSEGVKKVIDDQGSVVNLSKYSFPTSSYYDAETGTIKREKDAYVRVSKFMEAIYSAIAAQRLANDPALLGRPATSGPATLKEGGSFVPWARGRIFPKEIADEINRYYGAKPHSFAKQLTSANDFLKSVKYTMDVSAPLNQGLLMMTRFPLRWAATTLRSYAALADTKQLSRYLQPRMDDAVTFVTHGGSLGSLQDFLIGAQKGALASRIPVVKQLAYPFIRRSAESMNTFLSIAKLEMFRAWRNSVEPKDLPKLIESIENMSLSGRMEAIGLTPARNLAERLIMNAPSYYRGAANLIAGVFQGGPQGMVSRQSLSLLATSLSLFMLAAYKGSKMSDEEIKERFDPGNSKFLRYPVKLRNGDVLEEGPGNVVIQIARLLGNTLDVASGKKPSGSGIEGNPVIRWASYRSSPLVQLGLQIATGKDYLWRDISMKEAVGRSVLPISVEQFVSKEKPWTKTVEATTSFFGASSYPESYSTTRQRLQDDMADSLYGKTYDSLVPRERAKITETIAPAMDVKREETGPPSLKFIEKQEKIRQEHLVQGLASGQKEFLDRNKLKLPGYRLQTTVRGTEVFYTKKEEELFEKLLIPEYQKAVQRLQEYPNFDALTQKQKDVRFDRLTSRARENAKRLLQKEIRAVH